MADELAGTIHVEAYSSTGQLSWADTVNRRHASVVARFDLFGDKLPRRSVHFARRYRR